MLICACISPLSSQIKKSTEQNPHPWNLILWEKKKSTSFLEPLPGMRLHIPGLRTQSRHRESIHWKALNPVALQCPSMCSTPPDKCRLPGFQVKFNSVGQDGHALVCRSAFGCCHLNGCTIDCPSQCGWALTQIQQHKI